MHGSLASSVSASAKIVSETGAPQQEEAKHRNGKDKFGADDTNDHSQPHYLAFASKTCVGRAALLSRSISRPAH